VKNNIGLFGIIALTAVIGFLMVGCNQSNNVMPPVDRTALGGAIAGAQTLLAGTAVSEDGVGIASGYWAPQAATGAFTAAIATAQGVYGDTAATQATVNAATETLAAARATFAAARQPGTYTPAGTDRTALGGAIADARLLLAGTAVSADGTDVAVMAYWATHAAHNAFAEAVDTAQDVHDDTDAAQAQIDAAVTALAAARATFDTARQLGTSATAVDRTALAQAITGAQALLAQTETSTDGTDLPTTAYWTTATVRTAFDNAINTAQGVHDDTDATQAQIDAAVTALAAARATFDTARLPGTYTPVIVDRAALGGAIADARLLLAGTAVSTDGTDVAVTAHWATQAAHTAFVNAVDTAQGIHDDTDATQAQIDTAVTALTAARAAFDTARLPGTVDRTALAQAITAARALLAQTETSTDGTDLLVTAYWTTATVRTAFTNAVNAAQGVHDNTAATQTGVDAATTTLEAARATFDTARLPGTFIPGGDFEIDFSPGMATNVQGPTVYLGYVGQPPGITLLNPGQFNTGSIRWMLGNGEPVPAAALSDGGATLILNLHVHGNRTGEHRVTVEARIDGVLHGTVVYFTVEL